MIKKGKQAVFLFVLIGTLLVAIACTPQTSAQEPKDLTKDKSAQEIVEKSFDQWYGLDNYEMDLSSNIKVSMEDETLDMSTAGKLIAYQDPMKIKMVMDMTMPGVTENIQVVQYMVEDEDQVIIYQNIQDTWQKRTIKDAALAETMKTDPRDNLKLFMDHLKSAEIVGEEKIGDAETVKIDLVASGEIFDEVFKSTAGENLGISEELYDSEIFSNIGDLLYVIWIDKNTLNTVKCQMDLSEAMKNVGSALGEQKDFPPEMKQFFENMEMSMEYTVTNHNAAEEFTIPEEAKNTQEMNASLPS